MANAITRVVTWLSGDLVGKDDAGNTYFQEKRVPKGRRRRRWVIYADGNDEATRVPPEWHGWLHYTIDEFPSQHRRKRYTWEREHVPNLTGTPATYRPPGHTLRGGQRDPATGDYEAWTPE